MERMGTDATEAEAEAMLEILNGRLPSECSEKEWATVLIPKAIRLAARRSGAAALGSIKSPAKARASRANGAKGGRLRKVQP